MSSSIEVRPIGSQGLKAGSLGFGAMGLTAFYGPPTEDEKSLSIIKQCIELGINLIDTAEVYRSKSTGEDYISNESVVGKAIKMIGREKVVICTKHFPGGWEAVWLRKSDQVKKEDLRNVIKTACENSLKELDVDCIDLYYLHRMYPKPITIEDVMEVYKELIEEGKIKYVGLSEAPPEVIKRAHKVTPISAVQQEWSLIARDLEEEGGIVDTCRELGIGLVPYSPVARGFLTGQYQDKPPADWRSGVPYMMEENLKENAVVVREIENLAKEKNITLAQLSLAWVINQGKDVFPIPGTTKISHLEENARAAQVELTHEEMTKIAAAAAKIRGERGNEGYMSMAYNALMH